jgi:biopolymer transport protein TolR
VAQGSRGRRPISEINVVPYIDVMLVLLVIFMVTAPLLTQGIQVELPRAPADPVNAVEPDRAPLVLSIDAEGRLFLNVGRAPELPLDRATAQARVTAVLRRSPGTQVLLKGDRRVDYGRVVDAMLMLQAAGAGKVGFLTETVPVSPEPPGSRGERAGAR